MGQLASRYWEWTRRPEGETDERDDAGMADAQREGAGASSRSTGGGVRAAIDAAAIGPAPGIDPVAVRLGGPGAGAGLAPGSGAGDR